MRKMKVLFTVLLLFAFILSISVGCANQGTKSNVSETSSASTNTTTSANAEPTTTADSNPFKDNMKISIAFWDIANIFKEGVKDDLYDTITKKFNISIEPVNITWDNYNDKINIWAASGQLPDVYAFATVGSQIYRNWATQGIIHALPDDLSKYPDLAKVMSAPSIQSFKDSNGKLYFIPRGLYTDETQAPLDDAFFIRKDWMDKAGITQDPQTEDEFINTVKTIMAKDPEGRGKDLVGLTASAPGAMAQQFFLSYNPALAGAPWGGYWVKDNGKYIPSLISNSTLNGIKAFKKAYDAGIIDKDFAILKGTEGLDKFVNGRAIAYYDCGNAGYINSNIYGKFTKAYPGKKLSDCIKIIEPWKNSDGKYYTLTTLGFWSESYINAKVDDKKLDRILSLFDYLYSDQGIELTRFGINGVDYNKNGDKYVLTGGKLKNDKYPSAAFFASLGTWDNSFGQVDPNINEDVRKFSNDAVDMYKRDGVARVDPSFKVTYLNTPLKDKFVFPTIEEILAKIVLSKDSPETGWEKVMKDFNDKGLQQMIDEVNKKVTEMGIN